MVKSFLGSPRLSTLEALDNNEQVICDVRQHPFGIIAVYVMCLFGIVAAFFLVAIFLPDYFGKSAQAYSLIALVSVVVGVFLLVAMAIATFVYRQSRLTVTNTSIIQVIQGGLFTRKISQISLANVEDVTSEQNGVFANIFSFGTVKVETAGEQVNFIFNYSPQPARVAKIILQAKADFMITSGQSGSVRNTMPKV